MKSNGKYTGLLVVCAFLCTVVSCISFHPDKESITVVSTADPSALMNEGILAYERGKDKEAFDMFEKVVAEHKLKNNVKGLSDALVRSAQVCLSMGRIEMAFSRLGEAENQLKETGDGDLETRMLELKGNLLHSSGKFEEARKNLEKALDMAKINENHGRMASIYNNLGNLYGTSGDYEKAVDAYRSSVSLDKSAVQAVIARINLALVQIRQGKMIMMKNGYAPDSQGVTHIEDGLVNVEEEQRGSRFASINRATVLVHKSKGTPSAEARQKARQFFKSADDELNEAGSRLKFIGTSRHACTAYINMAAGLMELSVNLPDKADSLHGQASDLLKAASDMSVELKNPLLGSYANGYLGLFEFRSGNLKQAGDHTYEAIMLSENGNAPESLYRWQGQDADILKKQGRFSDAVISYKNAISTLESVRAEFENCYGRSRAELRRKEAEIYSGYVDALLSFYEHTDGDKDQNILRAARDAVEKRKVFELREYFNDDCLGAANVEMTDVDEILDNAVVIYPVILPERLEIIATFSQKGSYDDKNKSNDGNVVFKHYVVPVKADEIIQTAEEFRLRVGQRGGDLYLGPSQKLYNYLIRPLENELKFFKPETLVFVPDGVLNTIPIAALHDGVSFLISSYAVAVTPGLKMTKPKPIDPDGVHVLAVGISKPREGYEPLPGVQSEVKAISDLFKGKVLLDDSFSTDNFEKALRDESYNVVHIASHGKFFDRIEDSFILASDKKMTLNDLTRCVGLYRFRDKPLELLTLSACETATGNEQAALGLAGIAVKIGARSALATLWAVDDQAASKLVSKFYTELGKKGVSRSVALKRAETTLIEDTEYSHPGYWSPFILINNWL